MGFQGGGPAGPGRSSTPSSEQSASRDASRQQQGGTEQPENGRAEAYRQQAAPRLSQPSEGQPQAVRDPTLKASTGSKSTIRDLLASYGIYLKSYAPAQHNALICPTCKGGSGSEESLSLKIEDDSQSAVWKCHRGTCGWEGGCSLRSDSPGAPGIPGEMACLCPVLVSVSFAYPVEDFAT